MLVMDVNSWVTLDSNSLNFNVEFFKKHLKKDVKFCAVVKSNAYGHGLVEVVSVLKQNKLVDWWAVNSLDEALIVRSLDIKKRILIMGAIPKQRYHEVIKNNLDIVVFNEEIINDLSKIKGNINIHIKIDTGMGRLGFIKQNFEKVFKKILKIQNIKIQGVMSHFANSEDVLKQNYAKNQIQKFENIKKQVLKLVNDKNIIFHICSSSGVLLFKDAQFDMVRVGIGLYGLWPSYETRESFLLNKHNLQSINENNKNIENNLKPILKWSTKIVSIKILQKGEFIGYGCSYKLKRDSKIAVLPVGYFEGYSRLLSNKASVLIKNNFCAVLGRICMNMCMIDITDIDNVNVGDEVILIGEYKNKKIIVEDLAKQCDTINYEFITRINESIKRIVL